MSPGNLPCSFPACWRLASGEIGTRKGTRKLGCHRHALFGLAWFRDKGDIPRLGAGFGLPRTRQRQSTQLEAIARDEDHPAAQAS